MLKENAIPQIDQFQDDGSMTQAAPTDSFWAQGRREVRFPERLLCYHLAAERAEAQRQLVGLPETSSNRQRLKTYIHFLQCRLSVLNPPDRDDEIGFHFAILKRSLRSASAGKSNQRDLKHAARLLELIPGGSPEELLLGIADGLTREVAVGFGMLSYSPELYYLCRHQGSALEMTKNALDKLQAENLLSSLNGGLRSWDELETAGRVPVYCHPIRPSGHLLWVELDEQGFWIFARSLSGCSMLNLPFPSFEETQHYIEGSLTADLMVGAFLGSHWNRQPSE